MAGKREKPEDIVMNLRQKTDQLLKTELRIHIYHSDGAKGLCFGSCEC